MHTTKEETFNLLKNSLLEKAKKDNPGENIQESDDFIQSLLNVAKAFFETGIEFGKKEACIAVAGTIKSFERH